MRSFGAFDHDGEMILEVFAIGPISGGVGLLASKMLRGGFRPDEVANSLNKVTGTHAVWFNERLLTSPEQAVAERIRITMRRLANAPDSGHTSDPQLALSNVGLKLDSTDTSKRLAVSIFKPESVAAGLCPNCKDPLIPNGSCPYCRNCAWSKCS